ncbi:chitinase-like protein Idgf4 [Chelonus insularis]|uniref:chitinase-like protein Idgf4 n=1 Tax=Chelonus insularis TaxID=460826 RepID=UPI001589616A|nr:chitinase-like protein Idgf4 [Chelonus insularis]
MKQFIRIIFLGLVVRLGIAADQAFTPDKFVCYWNSSSFTRSGPAKVNVMDLKPALSLCTHLIYNSAGINSRNYEVVSLKPKIETDSSRGLYRDIVDLKKCFPTLKVYLGIGGGVDPDSNYEKYLTVVEKSQTRNNFITSVIKFVTDFNFDGVDLAWQFPPVDSKKSENSLTSSLVNYAKSWIGRGAFKDEKVAEHRKGFSNLVWDLNSLLKQKNKALTLTVLPHVNVTAYYDPKILAQSLDAIHLMAFDKATPDINPETADYPAPIYSRDNFKTQSIHNDVSYWTNQKTPNEKIVIGIPTHARTWKLGKSDSQRSSGVPPVAANGPGDEGVVSSIPGFLSYAEVCNRLNDKSSSLIKIDDYLNNKNSYGSYAYRPYNPKSQEDGIWIGYESYVSAENKALFAKKNGLGGVAIWDLSNDDVHGTCDGNRFPITSAAKFKLA